MSKMYTFDTDTWGRGICTDD